MSITETTTSQEITAHLDARSINYSVGYDGALQIERARAGGILLVWWDEQDPQNKGWAWRCDGDSDGLDSFDELDKLVGDASEALSNEAITAETTANHIIDYLNKRDIDWKDGPLTVAGVYDPRGAIIIGSLLVYFDCEDPTCKGWAWRDRDSSGALDSFDELDKLVGDAVAEAA